MVFSSVPIRLAKNRPSSRPQLLLNFFISILPLSIALIFYRIQSDLIHQLQLYQVIQDSKSSNFQKSNTLQVSSSSSLPFSSFPFHLSPHPAAFLSIPFQMSPPRRIPSTSSIANSNNHNPTTTSSAAGPATGRRIASHSSIASLASNGGGSANGNHNGGMGLGSGSNTELRAQLRRERDAQKREATTTITSSSSSQQHLHHSTQPLPHSTSSNNNNSNFNHGSGSGVSNSNTSPSNKAVETQSNTTVGGQRRVISEGGLSIPQSQSWNNNQVQSSHHHHHQPSQRITASASNSSLGSNHTNASSNPARPTSASTADTSPFEHQLQPLQQQHPSVLQPPEPFDNSVSLQSCEFIEMEWRIKGKTGYFVLGRVSRRLEHEKNLSS